MRCALSLALLLASSTALAVPATLSHQGRLMDAVGVPLDGPHDLDVAIYDAAAGGAAVWSDTITVTFDNGYFSTPLGDGASLDLTAFDADDLWLGMGVDGGPELPQRPKLHAVPYAFRADAAAWAATADSVTGGSDVDAASISINGTTVIDSAGRIDFSVLDNVPPDADSLAGVTGCASGDLLGWNGSAWDCATTGTTWDAAAITSGVLDVARIPVGSGPTDVAAGDHAHGFGQITGLVGFSQLPVGATGTEVAAGDHTHPGYIPGAPGACGSGNAGELAWDGTTSELLVCDGSAYVSIAGGAPDGGSQDDAGLSCKDLLSNGVTADGVYWVDPNGGGTSDAFEAYCDMTTDGGGWTLVAYAGTITGNKTSTAGTSTWQPLFYDWGTYDADANSNGASFSRVDMFDDIFVDAGSFMARRTSVPDNVYIWPVADANSWRVSKQLPDVTWLRFSNDGSTFVTRSSNVTNFNGGTMPVYTGYNWNTPQGENCDNCGRSYTTGLNHRSTLYWETNDAGGNYPNQWWHGSPMTLTDSTSPWNTVQDLGMYYRE